MNPYTDESLAVTVELMGAFTTVKNEGGVPDIDISGSRDQRQQSHRQGDVRYKVSGLALRS